MFDEMAIKMIALDLRGFNEKENAMIEELAQKRQLSNTIEVAVKDYFKKIYPSSPEVTISTESDILNYLNNPPYDRSPYLKSMRLNTLKQELEKGKYKITANGEIKRGE